MTTVCTLMCAVVGTWQACAIRHLALPSFDMLCTLCRRSRRGPPRWCPSCRAAGRRSAPSPPSLRPRSGRCCWAAGACRCGYTSGAYRYG